MICYRCYENVLVWHPCPWGTGGLIQFPELAENPPPHIAAKLAESKYNIVSATDPPEFEIIHVISLW